MPILQIKNVKYKYCNGYQTVDALRGVTCDFELGHFYAIMGESGSGKSTLLSLMAGLMLPTEGTVICDGKMTTDMDLAAYRRNAVSVVYQNFQLLPLLTVEENIMFPMELSGKTAKQARAEAQIMISHVGLPNTVLIRYPHMLSGGEQQRVAIARALGTKAPILLCDEPTGNLDVQNSKNIFELFSHLAHELKHCVIVVTHSEELATYADYIIRLRDGEIIGLK